MFLRHTTELANRGDSHALGWRFPRRTTALDCVYRDWNPRDASDTRRQPLMQYLGIPVRNTCTRMGRSRVHRMQHVFLYFDRRDACSTIQKAESSTSDTSVHNRHKSNHLAPHLRKEHASPCFDRQDASGTNRSATTAHRAPTFHSTCNIHS